MPEFTTVSLQEAQTRTIPGRQGKFINEYADYIQHVPKGQVGRLRTGERENPPGNDLYFWRDNGEEEQPRSKRRYTRRVRSEEETTPMDQEFTAVE